MKHEDIAEKLSEYRDGALDAAEREAVSRHLLGCADCSGVLADWERLSRAFLRRAPEPTAFQTEGFAARVMSRLPASEAGAPAWLTGRWLVPALGLSFAFLAMSFRSYPGAEPVDPSSALLMSSAESGGPSLVAMESPAADALGLGAEER